MPRPHSRAPLTAAIMTLVGAALTALYAGFPSGPTSVASRAVSVAVPVVLTLFGVYLLKADGSRRTILWVTTPVLGTIAVAVLDLGTHDPSAAGQVFLCYPVLFAASQLRAGGAIIAAGAAVIADVVVAFSLEPVTKAITDVGYVGATLIAMTVLLVTAGERLERLIARLEEQAAVDPLTGLATRRVLDQAASSGLAEMIRGQGVALILLDVDFFKTINDTYGHPVGDAALSHLAQVLRTNIREDAVIGRLGGDELAVLLPGCSDAVAYRRAVQLVNAIRSSPLRLSDGREVAISVSAGVSQAPRYAAELRTLYTSADQALYNAKRTGRDRAALPDSIAGIVHLN